MLMIIAMMVFAAQDGISKHLAQNYSIIFITMVRYWFFGAFVIVLSARRPGGLRAVTRTAYPLLQCFRGALLALEICVMVTAFVMLGLVESHAVFAAYPLMVAALSGPVLGERVGWRRWLAIGVGFAGVLMILRPGLHVVDPAALIALLAAIMFALYHLATRYVSRVDGGTTSFFYTGCKCRMKSPQKCRTKIPHFRVLGSGGIRHGGLRFLAAGRVVWGPVVG